jgi:hypothetical protein
VRAPFVAARVVSPEAANFPFRNIWSQCTRNESGIAGWCGITASWNKTYLTHFFVKGGVSVGGSKIVLLGDGP